MVSDGGESIKKMLRSVLQSSKEGVSLSRLQADFHSLCGHFIPLKALGFSSLEDYLRSIPSVVRLDRSQGQLRCFATVCKETAHIAELVAKQKSSKKSGQSQLLNCKMRVKKRCDPCDPYAASRFSLRQPSAAPYWTTRRIPPQNSQQSVRGGGTGVSRGPGPRPGPAGPRPGPAGPRPGPAGPRPGPAGPRPGPAGPTAGGPGPRLKPVEQRRAAAAAAVSRNPRSFAEQPPRAEAPAAPAEPGVYSGAQVQARLEQLLQKYRFGLWMSKLPQLYQQMFAQQLHPQALEELHTWTHICMVEKLSSGPADYLIYPPLSGSAPKPSPPSPLVAPQAPPPSSPPSLPKAQVLVGTKPSGSRQPVTAPPGGWSSATLTSEKTTAALNHQGRRQPPAVHASPSQAPPIQPSASPAPSNSSSTSSPTPSNRSGPSLSNPSDPAPSNRFGPTPSNSSSPSGPAPSKPSGPALCSPSGPAPSNRSGPAPSNPSCPSHSNHSGPAPSDPSGPALSNLSSPSGPTPSNPAPSNPSSPAPSNPSEEQEALVKVRDLLVKYSHGLWAPALPRLYCDTYKVPLPQHLLEDLSLLMDFCRVDYPMAHDKTKAILYYCSRSDGAAAAAGGGAGGADGSQSLPSGVALVSPLTPPPLLVPVGQFPSVLVTETQSSSTITIRYVGDGYSGAQENMEENMRCFYSQEPTHLLPSSLVIGQLVAVRAEQGEELARAQVLELLGPDSVKVYYVDYGFSAVTSVTSLLELHQDFLSLPFQATNVQLAGLESFSSQPALQASLEEVAAGKILLMEVLEVLQFQGPPEVVLYDTSQEEDVNINAVCLGALQDQTMKNLLSVNVSYEGVSVTSVSSEGVVSCQLASRGASRLRRCLEDIQAIFSSQVTSESLLSRPFAGQLCLARHQGSWCRVQIISTFGSRVVEILFIDLGLQATVEVTDLRSIPSDIIQDLAVIPPQATRCRLAELPVPEGDWSPEVVHMVKEALLNSHCWTMKVVKLEQHKDECLAFVFLFVDTEGHDLDQSVNRQLLQSHLWKQVSTPERNALANTNGCDAKAQDPSAGKLDQVVTSTLSRPLNGSDQRDSDLRPEGQRLALPPALELPPAGQNLDVFVPVACHPGHFVLQLWAELHKLMVLSGEMMLYYNRTWKLHRAPNVHKGELYAAKIDKNWRRVLAKAVLANGLVSVYELDYGGHELVPCRHFQLLIEEFRQLPCQAITAQLAGVSQRQWSEEASVLFRNHVEDRALVAKVESVEDFSEVQGETWERRWTVFLVDTTQEDQDLWVHSVMADIGGELSSAA